MVDVPLLSLRINGQAAFDRRAAAAHDDLCALSVETVQVNVGLRCNLACRHCHVESSPTRSETMDWATMELVLLAAEKAHASTLDVTGGAPEMHRHFRRFVVAGLGQGIHVMVRTNLTIMLEDGYEDLPEWLATHQIHLIASLPCYLESNVDKQRGKHVYQKSIEVIRRLNACGYGGDLPLDLVYNPVGASLPPDQAELEADYRRELERRFGIRFSRLYTLTNLPIGRFRHDLERQGKLTAYAQQLEEAYNPATLAALMCRHQLHVGWDGTLYDCDFNFAAGLPVSGPVRHVRDFDPKVFLRRRIATADHCFGCTAGCGSSCGGSLI